MNPWNSELWRFSGLLLVGLILGVLTGHLLLFMLIIVSGYLYWHMRNLYRLERWLHIRGKFQPPQGKGIWADVFDQIYRLQKRNRSRKKKLATYLTRFQSSTAAMPDATVVLDPHGQIEWINNAAVEILHLRSKKDVGQLITNLIRTPAFLRYFNADNFDEPLETPAPYDESVFLSIRVVPYGKNQRLLIARDITRLRRLEQMRRDFIANISHELRTPLTVINGYLEALVDEEDPNLKQWDPTLTAMQQQSTRMRNIVEDLLTLSRLELNDNNIQKSEVSIPGLIATIHSDARALSGGSHTFDLEIDDTLWLQGGNNELHSAFSNLIFNAVRYTPEGGTISIRWFGDAAGAHLEVKDDGIGIPPQHVPRLTERFYRVDIGRSRDSGGTGLGLAIVKHVLHRHQGHLRIYSEVGKGSTFCCDFPPSVTLHKPQETKQQALS